MPTIICATRGGEASRRTQERAVALAKERGARLIFLYVADRAFAGPVEAAMADALDDELGRLGTSLLRIAQARAREQGVDAEMEVRFGPVWETIETVVHEVGAETLVLGAPPQEQVEALGRWADHLRELGIEVIVVA